MSDLLKLAEPFPPSDIEWRIGQSGKQGEGFWAKVLAYVTNRAIMQRLDDVCGPANWRNEYTVLSGENKGFLCGISIRTDDGWVTKWDGAEQTDIESVKGGLSNAMKRAAVQWGVGRYLYDLEEGWAKVFASKQPNSHYAKTKDGVFYWQPPELPRWALPTPPDSREVTYTPPPVPVVDLNVLTLVHTPADDKDWWRVQGDRPEHESTLKAMGFSRKKSGSREWYTGEQVVMEKLWRLLPKPPESLSDFPRALNETKDEKDFAERIGA